MSSAEDVDEALIERAKKVSSEIARLTNASQDEKRRLDKDDERILNYFWNSHHEVVNPEVPVSAIMFLEVQRLSEKLDSEAAARLVALWMKRLVIRGYLVADMANSFADPALWTAVSKASLTAAGSVHLGAARLPKLKVLRRFADSNLKVWQMIGTGVAIGAGLVTIGRWVLGV